MSGHVTIAGAGAAGVLVLLHLLRHGRSAPRITLIGDAAPGEGVAYATRRPEHLLNVSAGRMSAFEDDPDHFVRHLGALPAYADRPDLPATFVPRRDYALYLKATLAAALETAEGVEVLADEVIDLQPDVPLQIDLRAGNARRSDALVLATGNAPRQQLGALAHGVPASRVIGGWDIEAIAALDADATLCIAGTGLSMVDAVLTRMACGQRAAIHVVSRHGLMPLPHTAHGQLPFDLDAFAAAGLAARVRGLREAARACAARELPWQWLMDTLRPHNVRLWRTLDADDQRRFLRHVARYWDVHRHRIAPEVHARLHAAQADGRLQPQHGRLRSLRWTGGAVEVTTDRAVLTVDAVIDCTGLQTDPRRWARPLHAALLRKGLVRPGPHGIGLDSDEAAAAIGAGGSADPRIRVIGSARIGQRWESVAIPELRVQAAALAQDLIETI